MLIHEFTYFLKPSALGVGWDEVYDSTSTPNYTYYGLARLGQSQSDPVWYIIVYKNSPQAVRYYPEGQIWSTRTTVLALP